MGHLSASGGRATVAQILSLRAVPTLITSKCDQRSLTLALFIQDVAMRLFVIGEQRQRYDTRRAVKRELTTARAFATFTEEIKKKTLANNNDKMLYQDDVFGRKTIDDKRERHERGGPAIQAATTAGSAHGTA
ncbi:hypothetical protein EVAR_10928_1 [Eumeta japonica]|uniref:Uncharacterized protein n=1 Tax=Eumeta variegata TaxID=151549 RepID=A0A4C1U621_EUMVA|nr:hypothetical protein EVAR_10928_1 [Eumeta japonica]